MARRVKRYDERPRRLSGWQLCRRVITKPVEGTIRLATAGGLEVQSSLNVSRRTMLKMAWGAVTVIVTPVGAFGWSRDGKKDAVAAGNGFWSDGTGKARFRIDGVAKVMGRKIYARDFRARDLPGWPAEEKVGLVLHATHADRCLQGIDLSMLPTAIQPERIIDAALLTQDKIAPQSPDSSPPTRKLGFMAEVGLPPGYLGQPVAILIFSRVDAYREAYRILRFNNRVVQYGAAVPVPVNEPPYQDPTYLTYLKGRFSQTQNGKSDPYAANPKPVDCQARATRAAIQAEVTQSDWTVFESRRSTQCLVPMFMEPEAGLGWMHGEQLHLVIGTQSPNGDVGEGLKMLKDAPRKVREVHLVPCYLGGGFGGRDVSPFTPLLIIAAYYTDGPVRLAYDRYAQFQAGLTQLPAEVEQRIAIDAKGDFQSIQTSTVMPSGGKNNYSQFVAQLAAYSAGGAYRFPRAIVDATAIPSTAIVAGSMRGFGGVQAAFALETAVDEIARRLNLDPVALRRRNALRQGDQTVTGAPLVEPMRIDEICDRAAANPLWHNRRTEKKRRNAATQLYGVGFAIANQAYGTGSDGVMGDVCLEPDGTVFVRTPSVDMGQGSATTLALAPARWLGVNASRIDMGQVDLFANLQLTMQSKASPGKQNASQSVVSDWDDPHYTKAFAMSSSACITAFHQFHAVNQSAEVLFQTGIIPAAITIWNAAPAQAALASARWERGELRVNGFKPLTLADIARVIHERRGVTEVMVHAYFAGAWVEATYQVGGVTGRWQIDGLSTRKAGTDVYEWQPRSLVQPPPTNSQNYGRSLYSPSATIAAVVVYPKTGQVEITDVYSYLDAGKVHQPDLVIGQYQGGVAMGVGNALLEDCPRGTSGPGNGRWNLNRYHVALAGDLPLDRIKLEVLPPLGKNPTAKGIAESVLCPIPAAIANAVADATGHVFGSLPITAANIREALEQ